MTEREFDVVVFGASGYTGLYVVEQLANSVSSIDLKWAIAGRNLIKLQESLDVVQGYLHESHGKNAVDISKTTIIQADVQDHISVLGMCSRAKLILNCVGPYKLYGEIVVSACIESGTHHVDISAEGQFMETVQAKYFHEAEEKGVYIIEACGFGSLPVDYGLSLLKKEFPGDLNSVEYFIQIGKGPEGRTTNAGTFLSMIESFKDTKYAKKNFASLRASLFKKELVYSNLKLNKRFPPFFYSREVNGWCYDYSLFGPDERVIQRSQQFRNEYFNERPIHLYGYLQCYSFLIGLGHIFMFGLCFLMYYFSLGRSLLTKYLSFFTAGEFSSTGPTRTQILEGSSTITLYSKGWTHRSEEPTKQNLTNPDKQMKLTISGPEIGYMLTSICMVQAGLVVLQESERLPLKGGVLTPGVAFENTSLRERLEKHGITFKFEEIK